MEGIERIKTGKLILCFYFLISIISCEPKDDASPIFIQILPDQSSISTVSGSKLIFTVTVNAQEELSRFSVTQTDNNVGVSVIFDTLITHKLFEFTYIYDVPKVEDSLEVLLTFKAETSGHNQSITRRIMITGDEELLEETTGHIMYSALSGREYAFNIDMLQAVFPMDNTEDSLHFQDNSIDTIHGNILSREWISPAGYHFVRFEDMRYAEATSAMVQDAYDYGTHLSRLQHITDDDIIILGEGNGALAAILITQVIDTDSTLNDKYIFNMKRVR